MKLKTVQWKSKLVSFWRKITLTNALSFINYLCSKLLNSSKVVALYSIFEVDWKEEIKNFWIGRTCRRLNFVKNIILPKISLKKVHSCLTYVSDTSIFLSPHQVYNNTQALSISLNHSSLIFGLIFKKVRSNEPCLLLNLTNLCINYWMTSLYIFNPLKIVY